MRIFPINSEPLGIDVQYDWTSPIATNGERTFRQNELGLWYEQTSHAR